MGMIGNQLAAGTALTIANDSFNGTGSATAFTLSQSVGAATDIEVLVDNVQQSPYDSSYSVSGTTLTFSAAPAAGTNNIYVIYHGSKHISTNQVVPDDGSVVEAKLGAAAVTSAKLHSTLDLSGTGRTGHGGLKSVQVFTSSGTYTKPTGISTVKVIVTGGGGSGGGHGTTDDMGAGGGAGGTAIEVIDVSGVSTVTVTVGAGGAGVSGSNNGNAGGTSSFGSYCSATGGNGGRHGNIGDISGGAGGAGSGGNINILGGSGTNGWDNFNVANTYASGFGAGGSSYWGGGGRGSAYNNIAAASGYAYGSGGGSPHSRQGGTSGAGADGVVYIEEYA